MIRVVSFHSVEAMQLGDCGQEMALITNLTEGSKVFLSREESQHFIKESVSPLHFLLLPVIVLQRTVNERK